MPNVHAPTILFFLSAAGCATTSVATDVEERDATAAMDFAGVGAGTLATSLRLRAQTATKPDHVVATGEALHNNDRYSLAVRTSQNAYVYVVLVGADHRSTLLNPAAADQMIAAGCELRLPRAGSFAMRGATGPEKIKVIASAKPITDRDTCQDYGLPCTPAAGPVPACAKTRGEKARDIDPALKIGKANAAGIAEAAFDYAHEP